MRVWVDITDASAVVFFEPIVRRLEADGHTVTLTARRFAGADLVLRRYGLGGMLTTRHRGGGLGARTVGLVNRTAQLLGSASSGAFDVAVGSHASDFVFTAWTLAIPQMTFLDDDRLGRSNMVNVRLADEVAVPEAVATATLAGFGAGPGKFFRYPGFREEYYLYDVQPDPQALSRLGIDRRHVVGVVRPAADVVTPAVRAPGTAAGGEASAPAAESELPDLVRELAGRRNVTLVVAARDDAQRQRFAALGVKCGLIVPDGPVDGVGLIAAADFVVGQGGAMTREAAALGTPAYIMTARRTTAVDAALLDDGRLRYVRTADDIELRKKDTRTARQAPRDPSLFARRLEALARRRSRRERLGRLFRD